MVVVGRLSLIILRTGFTVFERAVSGTTVTRVSGIDP
jgi:hypothetical protein